MTERIGPLLRWAEGYYPSRQIEPPDIAGMNLTDAELIELFARGCRQGGHITPWSTSPPSVRLSDTTLSEAASAAWLRTQ